ncbi:MULTISPECIES: Type 1 glutamine amidotransferase-like domain-containing protein [Nannocystis]|jgi:hypothetical protein|uniref:Type 1 glutamine amidotransferase-like domain-containing protein n=1 Tax=Nannocystis TaxID=53 RepID=UPI002270CC8E|nr:Type 1 glutamine amidotransferase-like domain-containing protein [Nannocystis sp. RBIL2]MCY1067848.1 Type 1 glutamine amidotransferase-like domain-containing protein [Nannocystis sp. RBIL2]
MTRGVLLGPQRHHQIVDKAADMLGIDGQIAAVTAGWQEREAEDQELCAALGNRAVNLMLHARAETAFREDPELFAAHRAKQDRLRQLQDLYRLRLASHLKAARRVQQAQAPRDLIESELEEAVQAIRLLDAHHVAKTQHIQKDFDRKVKPLERPAVVKQLKEIEAILAGCAGVAIAGGHVAVLYNRLRLFDLGPRLADLPIIAWSAGAMVVASRIVLFHDSPPQGRGNAEVLEGGLGLFPGVVPLPHARRRLNLQDPGRITVFARRFAPATCVALDERCFIHFEGPRWSAGANTFQLRTDGHLVALH